jgi:hypothetical protein
MSKFDDELDTILEAFAKRIETIPRGKTYGWSEEKGAIKAAIATHIIGEDVPPYTDPFMGDRHLCGKDHYDNNIKATQRQALFGETK